MPTYCGSERSRYIVVAAAFVALIAAAIETDIFIPAMPAMQDYFGTSASKIQMLVSINFFGLCLSGLLYGVLSDAYGRRALLLAGLTIFCFGGIGCVMSTEINAFLFWRFIQGLGASACFVVPSAIIYDVFSKEKAISVLGLYSCVVTIVMAGAPMIGSYLFLTYDWFANFYFMMAASIFAWLVCYFLLDETLPEQCRQSLNIKQIGKSFRLVLTDKLSIGYLCIISCIFSAYFVFLSNLSLVFIDHLGVPDTIFPYFQGSVLMGFSVTSLFTGKLARWLGLNYLRLIGLCLNFLGSTALLLVVWSKPNNVIAITACMVVFSIGMGMCINIIFADAMNRFPSIKGIAASLMSSIRLGCNAAAITIAGLLFNGSMQPVGTMIFVFALVSISSFLWVRKHEH